MLYSWQFVILNVIICLGEIAYFANYVSKGFYVFAVFGEHNKHFCNAPDNNITIHKVFVCVINCNISLNDMLFLSVNVALF